MNNSDYYTNRFGFEKIFNHDSIAMWAKLARSSPLAGLKVSPGLLNLHTASLSMRSLISRKWRVKPGAEVEAEDVKGKKVFMKVHIWRTDGGEGRCGHSSSSLHVGSPDSEAEHYLGLWPNKGNLFFFNHPFAYLFAAVKGEIHSGRKFCEEREGEEKAVHPDTVYTIEVSADQYSRVKADMLAETERVKQGKVLYSLFPRINLVVGARFLANETVMRELMGEDFFLAYPEVIEGAKEVRSIRSEHCTTITQRVLGSAGYRVEESIFPWRISPIGLDDELERLSDTHPEISREVFEQPKKKKNYYSGENF